MPAEHSKFLQKERHRPARGLELFPYGDATHGRMTGNRNKPEQRVVQILRSPLYDEHAADAAKDEQRGVVYHIESGDNIEPVLYRADYISEILPELTADRDNERL